MTAVQQTAYFFFLLALAALLAGCVSTPKSRAERNADLFATFSEEDKAKILEGKIELGFTKEMVLMAAGKPDRRTLKKTKDGENEVWTFFKYYPRRVGGYGYGYGFYGGWGYPGGFYNPYLTHHRSMFPFPAYIGRGRKEKDLVVNFEYGEVIAFEEVL